MRIFLFSLLVMANSYSGAGSTGGGFVVHCPETLVSSETITLLDFYEADQQGLKLIQSTGDIKEDYYNSVDNTYTLQGSPNLAETRREEIFENLQKTMLTVEFLGANEELPVSDDIGMKPWIPSQCSIKQVAHYNSNSGTIYIKKVLWDKLDSLNRAGLMRHELFGRFHRKYNAITTEMARKFIGHTFSEPSSMKLLTDGLTEESKSMQLLSNYNNDTLISRLYVTNFTASRIIRFQFMELFSRAFLAKTWIDIEFDKDLVFSRVVDQLDPEQPHLKCVLTTPNVNKIFEKQLKGSMSDRYNTVKVHLKTGSQVKLTLYRKGRKIMSGFIHRSCY